MNECEESNGGCNQICNNTIGSFICECNVGYEIYNDTHCIGEHQVLCMVLKIFDFLLQCRY